MRKLVLIFILNSAFTLAKQDLKFEIKEKNNEKVKILIVKEKNLKYQKKNTKKIYIVKSGDTLSLIAKKFNMPIDYLAKINNIKNNNLIIINQKIIIKK